VEGVFPFVMIFEMHFWPKGKERSIDKGGFTLLLTLLEKASSSSFQLVVWDCSVALTLKSIWSGMAEGKEQVQNLA